MELNSLYGNKVLQGGMREAIDVAGNVKRLLQRVRSLWRSSGKSRDEVISRLKAACQRKGQVASIGLWDSVLEILDMQEMPDEEDRGVFGALC